MYHYLAFHSWDLYFKVVVEDTFNTENTFGMEDTYELDSMIGASPASASVLDIIAASATTAGAEDTSDDGLSIANHLCEGSLMDQAPSASFLGNNQVSQVAQDGISSTRQNYLIVFNKFDLTLFLLQAKEGLPVPCAHLAGGGGLAHC